METKKYYEDIDKYRAIPITKILGITPTGRRISIRCVMHNDKTPSLSLFKDGGYKCFGCGKRGSNAIDFCKDLGYTFKESLEELKEYL